MQVLWNSNVCKTAARKLFPKLSKGFKILSVGQPKVSMLQGYYIPNITRLSKLSPLRMVKCILLSSM